MDNADFEERRSPSSYDLNDPEPVSLIISLALGTPSLIALIQHYRKKQEEKITEAKRQDLKDLSDEIFDLKLDQKRLKEYSNELESLLSKGAGGKPLSEIPFEFGEFEPMLSKQDYQRYKEIHSYVFTKLLDSQKRMESVLRKSNNVPLFQINPNLVEEMNSYMYALNSFFFEYPRSFEEAFKRVGNVLDSGELVCGSLEHEIRLAWD